MNYRLATILSRLAIAADYTETIDLNLVDPVSQFHVLYESTGGSPGVDDGHAARCITKIELVDGSDVLFSLSGQECQAVDFYHQRKEPANLNVYLNAMNAEMIFNMNFGRHLYDPRFAFDPRKFSNPQLKITIDRNAGGHVSTAGFLTVLAKIFDGKAVEPEGFLMHKEVKNYGLGPASHEYTPLPTDFPFRKLLIMAQTEGTGADYLLANIKLSEDNDRKIPIDNSVTDILRALCGQTPSYKENILFAGGLGEISFYCTPCYWPLISCSPWDPGTETHIGTIYGGDGGKGTLYIEMAGGNWVLTVEGYAPHGAIEIPFGIQDDPDDWYDVTGLGSLNLDILSYAGRSDSDKVQVVLQQLRKYAA